MYGFLNPLEGASGPLYSIFPERVATGFHYIFKPINGDGLANFNVFITALISSLIITLVASMMFEEEKKQPQQVVIGNVKPEEE